MRRHRSRLWLIPAQIAILLAWQLSVSQRNLMLGRVLFKGREIATLNTDVGFVTQDSNLFPWLTAIESVEFPLVVRRIRRSERRDKAMDMLRLVGLTGFENAYPGELSGGMQKRVAMARTLIYQPDVILMDEPFGALDAQARMNLHHELLRIWSERKTTILFRRG